MSNSMWYKNAGLYDASDLMDTEDEDELMRGASIIIDQATEITRLCSVALLALPYLCEPETQDQITDICGRLLFKTYEDLTIATNEADL